MVPYRDEMDRGSDQFQRYSSREEYIANRWIERNKDWLPSGTHYIRSNTGYHDGILVVPYEPLSENLEFTVQVKEEEYEQYIKRGNIVLDYISAFYFKDSECRRLYLEDYRRWVSPECLEHFEKCISVDKWGKLKTCDAHLHIFYVENKGNEVYNKAFDNMMLRSDDFLNYIKSNYSLRITDKEAHGIYESWLSAGFPVKSDDPELNRLVVCSMGQLLAIMEDM